MFFVITSAILVFASAAPLSDVKNIARPFENDDPGEFGNYFEGDMLLSAEQELEIKEAMASRNGLLSVTKRWPEKTVVYYIVEDDFDEDQMNIIEEAMEAIANKSCIKFRSRVGEEHAVKIKGSADGCFSSVGFINEQEEDNEQVLNLARGCLRHGTIVHEMLHTLGFYHMQSTYNRDDFVRILWENISAPHRHNFEKYNNDTVTDFGVEYDYGSVMHYPEKAFSKNGNQTIIPLKENVKIGQRKEMSESDIIKLNRMYCEDSSESL